MRLTLALAALVLACARVALAADPVFPTSAGNITVETVASGLVHPWSLAFLPDGRMLVTERPGRMRIVTRDGKLSPPLAGVPTVFARSQAGMLDVALDRDFAKNRTIYFCFNATLGGSVAVARAQLDAGATPRLDDVTIIFRQDGPPSWSGNNVACRIAQAPDGNLFVSLGDHFGPRDEAQNLANHLGKIIRIKPDGSVPPDNPFVGKSGGELAMPSRRSGPTATAIRRASLSIPPTANCGNRSTVRRAATRSTSSRRERTTAGR